MDLFESDIFRIEEDADWVSISQSNVFDDLIRDLDLARKYNLDRFKRNTLSINDEGGVELVSLLKGEFLDLV